MLLQLCIFFCLSHTLSGSFSLCPNLLLAFFSLTYSNNQAFFKNNNHVQIEIKRLGKPFTIGPNAVPVNFFFSPPAPHAVKLEECLKSSPREFTVHHSLENVTTILLKIAATWHAKPPQLRGQGSGTVRVCH